MARKNPQQVAEKWGRNTSGAVNDYREGIMGVDVAPGQMAAAAADRYRSGLERSFAEGTWERNVAAVPLNDWKQAALEVGAGRIAAGVQKAQPKMASFMSELLPFQDQAKAQLDSRSPRGDTEQNIQRSADWQRMMSQFRRGNR